MRDRQDIDENPVTLNALCRMEPDWAANRIRALEGNELAKERDDAQAMADDLASRVEELARERDWHLETLRMLRGSWCASSSPCNDSPVGTRAILREREPQLFEDPCNKS